MNRLIITRLDGRILTALMDDMKAVQMDFEDPQPSNLGSIYIGKVKDVVQNINAAFVDLGGGVTGYYSLDANPEPWLASRIPARISGKEEIQAERHWRPASMELQEECCRLPGCMETKDTAKKTPRPLRSGDEIVVQVLKDAVKTKDPVLTSELTLTGRYCVLSAEPSGRKNYIRFSGKISDNDWKKKTTEFLRPAKEETFGLIVRTTAYQAPPEQILTEMNRLTERMKQILASAPHRTCFSRLYEEVPSCVSRLRDRDAQTADEILTDDEDIFQMLNAHLTQEQPDMAGRLRLYKDPLVPLSKLYSIEKNLQDALQKRVWLPSGAYLVIEQTEAMTVIDVNTGKFTGRKTMRDTVRMINLEAARETARQIRLRNLSGIILVDFINMESAVDREELMRKLEEYCSGDPVKVSVVDMTRLGLAELTRKKTRKPLHEQWR